MSSSSSGEGMFSFDTPQAVMHVLASVRKSDVAPSDKNTLRDLVLSYTNGGKDPSLKIQIEQKLVSLAIQPIAQASTQTSPTPVPEFGSSRSAPAFTVPAAAQAQAVSVPTPAAVPVVATSPVAPAQPAPVTPPASVSQPAVPSQPAPAVAPAQPVVQATPAAAPVPQPAPAADNTAALARVREIKSLVNEKIGNPVNLVDIDNKVGREYMSALLDSMKKLSSGVNSASTMERLEAAFAEVERVLEQPRPEEPVSVAPVQSVTPEPVAPSPPVAPVTPSPVVPSVSQPVPTAPAPVLAQKPVTEQVVKPDPVSTPVAPKTELKEEVKPELAEKPVTSLETASTQIEDSRWTAAAAAIKPAPVQSLAESAKPLKSVQDVPTQDSVTNKDDDPTQSQEVNQGLDQLLSDWVLFKKSGLFGTGPKGIEHPLYKNIKELQIPLLLAGRFEGATQEIKQSITDYMNGWRYEQGIIYEQGETFDHYLRRVIRHILDLQK